MTYNWYEFTYSRGKVKWIRLFNGPELSSKWHNLVDQGKPTYSNMVCAKDELDAYKIVSKWLRLGKPLDRVTALTNEYSKGVWRYTPDV